MQYTFVSKHKNRNNLKKLFFLLISLFIINHSRAQWLQIGQDIDGETTYDLSGYSVSLSSDGSILAIGAYGNDGNDTTNTVRGHVRVYKNQSGIWTQIGSDIDGEAVDDESGWSVSLSADGSTLAIGAPNNDGTTSNAGHVRVYENQSGTWIQIGSDIDGETLNDRSGMSVSLSSDGSVLAIGAKYNHGHGTDAGHVRIYENQSGIWTQIGSDIDGETSYDLSGCSVSLSADGSILAIGASGNDGNIPYSACGHVRIYEYSGGNWIQLGNDINGEAAGDGSGSSVSLSGDGSILAIGSYQNDGNTGDQFDERGHVRVYENQLGTWTKIGSDIDGEAAGDHFGWSVSLSSDGLILAIGANRNDGNGITAGHVRVYKNVEGNWTKIGSNIDGEAAMDYSGDAVSLSSDGSVLAIGATGNDGNGMESGHVRVYGFCGTANTISETVCNSYTSPSGIFTWTNSGTYIDTISNTAGCDSVITINLTINTADTSITQNGDTFFANAVGATYQWIYCDSSNISIIGEINQSFIATVNGNYAVAITQNTCIDTSSCYYVNLVGINENTINTEVFVYPNPATGILNIDAEGIESIEVFDIEGKHIYKGKNNEIDLSQVPEGIYYIKVLTNKQTIIRKLIKQ